MISLFLDTSSRNLALAIFKGDNKLYELIKESDNKLSDTLLPTIQKAFNEVKLKINDIDKIFIVNGPGSFTGVRIGCTFAKVAAYTLNKDLIPLSELELLATTKIDKKYVVSVIDARRENVYAGMYESNGTCIIEDKYINLNQLIDDIKKICDINDVIFVSYDKFEQIETIIPKIDIYKILNRHQKDDSINPHYLIPNYLKKTEAEEKLALNDKTIDK